MSFSQNTTMKFLVLMLSMAAAAVLAAPTPAPTNQAAAAQVVRAAAEKAPKFELPREVLRDVKSTDQPSTVCIRAPPFLTVPHVRPLPPPKRWRPRC